MYVHPRLSVFSCRFRHSYGLLLQPRQSNFSLQYTYQLATRYRISFLSHPASEEILTERLITVLEPVGTSPYFHTVFLLRSIVMLCSHLRAFLLCGSVPLRFPDKIIWNTANI